MLKFDTQKNKNSGQKSELQMQYAPIFYQNKKEKKLSDIDILFVEYSKQISPTVNGD